VRRLGNLGDFDNDAWEKKILKIMKALILMERHKASEPHFSKSFEELASFLKSQRHGRRRSCAKSDLSRYSINDQIPAFDSVWDNTRGITDSIMTNKEQAQQSRIYAKGDLTAGSAGPAAQLSDWPH